MAPTATVSSTLLDRIDADETLRLAQAMIRIPSVNPPGEEAAVAAYLDDYLRRAGLDVHVSEVLPGRPNVVATAEFGPGGRRRSSTVTPTWSRSERDGTAIYFSGAVQSGRPHRHGGGHGAQRRAELHH